jgi:hypothetical protein
MSYDQDWTDDTMETRRAMVRKTIRMATYEELKVLGEKRFPVVTDPWCARFNEFVESHKTSKFYQAEAPGGAEVIYCREADQGVWFLPGSGMGIIQPKGLQLLAEIVDAL